ncbi:4,5-DOPA dioxygenase extradiol [Rhizobium sp. KVB221]|uniref:4,5-DOPA dioxygenase extradiol n=1 Tax=Rhizobium setariae TaxID=2801340 RepID=A0A936YSP2_9HYPH|nr:4,5-DOPA dioxygenase extradiol [Rhizobium setariae]MBL0371700.1 4,5-DOPA dioxygenase extradiol [Rhizobium setariae]
MASLSNAFANLQSTPRMPALFVGHGSPMNAILDNEYSREWRHIGEGLPVPKAILVVSAHWMTRGATLVHIGTNPKTIHDFGGFPPELFAQQYNAPGAPDFAQATIDLLEESHAHSDERWGLDHGAWSVLIQMFPKADIPVYQLSLDLSKDLDEHFRLAEELKALREKGVLIIGSGNVVHNLRALSMNGQKFDWAVEFDQYMADAIATRDTGKVLDIGKLGRVAALSHPTIEHFLPILYPLAVMAEDEKVSFFNESFDMGSISMRSFILS